RVRDALRYPARTAGSAGSRGTPPSRADQLWGILVSVVHASSCGTSSQHVVRRAHHVRLIFAVSCCRDSGYSSIPGEKGARHLYGKGASHLFLTERGTMKTTRIMQAVVVAAICAIAFGAGRARPGSPAPIAIDNNDIGGVVTGPKGPEAGVWVIAE